MAQPTSQMFEHCLEELKGGGVNMHKVNFSAKWGSINATAVGAAGRVVHRTSAGVLALGAVGTQVPLLVFQNIDSADMSNPGVFGSSAHNTYAVEPTGNAGGPVCTGSYELMTTEYDTSDDWTGSYNAPLHSPVEAQITTGTDYSAAGKVFKKRNWPGGNAGVITCYTDNVIGFVSRGLAKTLNGQTGLAFYAHFLPGSSATV